MYISGAHIVGYAILNKMPSHYLCGQVSIVDRMATVAEASMLQQYKRERRRTEHATCFKYALCENRSSVFLSTNDESENITYIVE